MQLTRRQRFGILAAGSATALVTVIGKDVLLSVFIASATPSDAQTPPNTPTTEGQTYPAEPTAEGHDIITSYHGRRIASEDDEEIAAVGKLQLNGRHCTEQIAILPGYHTTETGTLLTTAAHCVLNRDPAELEFLTTYRNAAGEAVEFRLVNNPARPTQVWINPTYDPPEYENTPPEVRAEDTALVFYPGVTPPAEITPIKQRVFAYHMADYNRSVLTTVDATAAGFSGDLPQGKSVDDHCTTSQTLNGSVVLTDCKINKGGSGSGLLVRNVFNELESLAVLSGVSVKNDEVNIAEDSFRSYYAPYYHHQLEGVPFLTKPEQCVRVADPDGANLRMHADILSDTVGNPLIDGHTMRVRDILDWERAEIGDENVWLEVMETQDGRDGYIRSDLVVEITCPN